MVIDGFAFRGNFCHGDALGDRLAPGPLCGFCCLCGLCLTNLLLFDGLVQRLKGLTRFAGGRFAARDPLLNCGLGVCPGGFFLRPE